MLSFIPVILASGTIAGYFVGRYIEEKLVTNYFALPICIGIGTIASIIEVVRIIKLTLKIEKKG